MNDMKNGDLTNSDASKNKIAETKQQEVFKKPVRSGKVEYIEREVDRLVFNGYEVVRREWLSKANCPAVTIKYGKVSFSVRAIKKFDECRYIHILINLGKKLIRIKPCEEDDKDSIQWSRANKQGKVVSRPITCRYFTAQLYKDMKWDLKCTYKMLGTLLICKGEKVFEFNLMNAERYLSLAKPTEDNPKRRERVEFMPEHWTESYGQSYEESQIPIIETFEGMPDGYVKITLPPLPSKKPTSGKVEDSSNKKERGDKKDGTI